MNPLVAKLIEPVTKVIDSLVVTADERGQLRLAFADMQAKLAGQIVDFEVQLAQSRASAITAEASAEWAITATWRPLMMLSFGVMLWWYALAAMFGFPPPDLEAVPQELWDLMKLGIGGYVAGRSTEKIVKTVMSPELNLRRGKSDQLTRRQMKQIRKLLAAGVSFEDALAGAGVGPSREASPPPPEDPAG
jgi:hypothetical protein